MKFKGNLSNLDKTMGSDQFLKSDYKDIVKQTLASKTASKEGYSQVTKNDKLWKLLENYQNQQFDMAQHIT